MCVGLQCHWFLTEKQAFVSAYFRKLLKKNTLWVNQKRRLRKGRRRSPCLIQSHIDRVTHTHTHTGIICFSFFYPLHSYDYYHPFCLPFSLSICLSVRHSEENGSWWAPSFLMTWLIWGRLACARACGCVCTISFSQSNSKTHTDSPQLIPVKAISVSYLKMQLCEVTTRSPKKVG